VIRVNDGRNVVLTRVLNAFKVIFPFVKYHGNGVCPIRRSVSIVKYHDRDYVIDICYVFNR
jgi:hypothetical protein